MKETKAEKVLKQHDEQKKKELARQIIDNILYFAEAKGVSRSDLEKEADISAGYLAKLNRKDNTTIPNVEMLLTFAKKLGVTVDSLVKPRITETDENAEILLGFIEKVTTDTISGKIEWKVETAEELDRMDGISQMMEPDHPLFRPVQAPKPWPTDYPEYEGKYCSYFGDQCKSNFNGDCYHAELSTGGADLYIMNIETYEIVELDDGSSYDKEINCFELCLYKGLEVEPLCRTDLVSPDVDNAIRALYYTIKRELESNKLSKRAKTIISEYMREIEVPF